MDLAAEDEDCSVKDGWKRVDRRNGMPVGSRDVPGKRSDEVKYSRTNNDRLKVAIKTINM